MNTFMSTFVVLGLMYTGLAVWALALQVTISLAISGPGMLFCYVGWRFSRDHLQ